jgi:bilin biosynthesis PecE protein
MKSEKSEKFFRLSLAKVPNSLKLLNLKRILAAVLDNQHSQKQTSQLIFKAIDDLLF